MFVFPLYLPPPLPMHTHISPVHFSCTALVIFSSKQCSLSLHLSFQILNSGSCLAKPTSYYIKLYQGKHTVQGDKREANQSPSHPQTEEKAQDVWLHLATGRPDSCLTWRPCRAVCLELYESMEPVIRPHPRRVLGIQDRGHLGH